MGAFQAVRQYYEKRIEWQPDIKREWVEGYLKGLQNGKVSDHKLLDVWDNISMFMDYQERTDCHDLAKLPFWEYSVCLQWLGGRRGFRITRHNAEKFLLHLQDFYGYLDRNGHITSKQELDRAIEGMFSTNRLKLVDRIPYTGEETWTTVSAGNGVEATFSIKDFWLALLYEEYGSWKRLKEETRKAINPQLKLFLIESFYERLQSVGYATPQNLFRGETTYEDGLDARRWFYRGKTPSIKWMSL